MAGAYATLTFVSSDTKAIIGTIIGTGLAVIAVVVTLVGGVRADMRDMRAEIRDMGATLERFDDRLDAVEVALGKVVQRLVTLERLVLPPQAPR